MKEAKIINDDCLILMKQMADNSIDFVITDPPYGLHFMGKDWDAKTPGQDIWEEALRICKPGSMLAAFGGSRTHHHLMIAIERAGFEIKDCLMWLTGQGFPKSHNFGKQLGGDWAGFGTALKPAYEPIILAMKPLDGTYAQNAQKWGVAGINIDESRIFSTKQDQEKMKVPIGKIDGGNVNMHRSGERTQTFEPNSNGRWPTNIILDEEATEMLDQQTGNLGKSSGTQTGKNGSIFKYPKRECKAIGHNDSGGASRFFKCIESECFLCYNPCTKARINECNPIHAHNAKNNSMNTYLMKENVVQNNAQMNHVEQFAQNVKCVENLCDLCAMNIAQGLVEIKISASKIEELRATLDYIGNFKSSILIQNLALFAEQWENIDIIPTIENLSKLFGCVRHAIESYTKKEDHNQNGKNEPLRFLYQAKASTAERNTGCETNNHPTVKPISLMKYIIKLLAPPGDPLLLDPFAGSGSTLVAAEELGIRSIGIEKQAEYCTIAQKRLDNVKEEQQLKFNFES